MVEKMNPLATSESSVECVYCGHEVPDEGEYVPEVRDTLEWERLATEHAPDCEWILTRAHRICASDEG